MHFSPEIKFGADTIDITGIPKSIYTHVRAKVVSVLKDKIPEMVVVEELDPTASGDLVNVHLSNISGLDERKSALLDRTIEKLAIAFDKALKQLSVKESGFDRVEVSTSKKPILMFVLPGRGNDVHRKALHHFWAKLKKHLGKTPYNLVPLLSPGPPSKDGDREVFVKFPEDRLIVAAMAVESFFTKDCYVDLERDLVLKLIPPEDKSGNYTIEFEEDKS